MSSDVYRDYLYDLGDEIRRRAIDAKAARDALEKGSPDYLFQDGRSLAYYEEAISLMLQSAEGLGIAPGISDLAESIPIEICCSRRNRL